MSVGKVYFIECAGRIKIGYSRDVTHRIRELSTAAAHDLILLHTIPGNVEFERAIHRRLKTHRVRGEWFHDSPDLRAEIAKIVELGPAAIGFHMVPRADSKKPRVQSSPPAVVSRHDNPFTEAFRRLNACMDRYISEGISDAREEEDSLGLERGALINPLIGGYWSEDRWKVACRMLEGTSNQFEELIQIHFRRVIHCDPIESKIIAARAGEYVTALKVSLHNLFQNRDLSVTDLGIFEPLNADLHEEDLRKVKLRPRLPPPVRWSVSGSIELSA